jgi:MarR family transcriptional regulator, organic hydroperoxide resistance regulator
MIMTEPTDMLPRTLNEHLCFSLYATSLAFTKLYRPLLDAMGLTYPQYLVLLVLWERDGRAVKDLGEALGLDSGTLTPLLKRMEAAGLVSRVRDAADERRVIVSLTPQGVAMQQKAAAIPAQAACVLNMGAAEIHQLKQQIDRLRIYLEGGTPA